MYPKEEKKIFDLLHHCTDIPRKKYLLRSNNEWIIDPHADTLLTMTFNKMPKKEIFLSG